MPALSIDRVISTRHAMPHPAPPFPSRAVLLSERAPAKVNLTLRVLGRRADLYHELSSIVAFAGTGDRLLLTPGGALSLDIAGPNGKALAGGPDNGGDDNLVLRAARHLAEKVPGLILGHFHLIKRLPVAAGIGGGSADAAAALRLLARANALTPDDTRLYEAALATGSDVPACLYGRACVMSGRGETLTPLTLPRFGAVLVNPGTPVSTAEIFRALGLPPGSSRGVARPAPADGTPQREVLDWLHDEPNDLEAPARALAPVLTEMRGMLESTPGALLVRMSGSGATMFALYENCRMAAQAAKILAGQRPSWWVKSTVLS